MVSAAERRLVDLGTGSEPPNAGVGERRKSNTGAQVSEGAALGCLGAILITAANRQLSFSVLNNAAFRTAQTTAMVMVGTLLEGQRGEPPSSCSAARGARSRGR